MIRAVIIDDEPSAREALQGLLARYVEGVEVVGEAENVENGLRVLAEQTPDMLFLDVRLDQQTGFDMLDRLPKHDFHVVFTTAYDEYALRAIKVAAIDYLLKPINIDELSGAVEKVKAALKLENTDERISILLNNLQGGGQRLILPTFRGFVVRNIPEIVYCEADRNYTVFHFAAEKPITVARTLGDYADMLAGHGFVRTHMSYIVNVAEVRRYTGGRGGMITMSNGKEVPLAQRRKQDFLDQFKTF
ncbi:MAG: LytTR family DNA-binding domain-containing protein [Bacteroidota bacterium]